MQDLIAYATAVNPIAAADALQAFIANAKFPLALVSAVAGSAFAAGYLVKAWF